MSSDDHSPPFAPPDFHSSDRRPSLPFLYVWPSPPTSLPSSTLGGLPSPRVDLPCCISPNYSPLVSPESSTGCSTRRSSGQGQTTDHLKDFVLGSDESEALLERGLVVDNRAQMNDLMGWATEATDCEMAAEVVDLLVPHVHACTADNSRDLEQDRTLLQRFILYWTSLTPHSLCVLISTIILLERLKRRHPGLSSTGQLHDTALRVVFSAYLIAMKLCTEVSYLNQAFTGRTPWSLQEINAMERELLVHLSYELHISVDEFLARATPFWQAREQADARRFRDDGSAAFGTHLLAPNLFMESSPMDV